MERVGGPVSGIVNRCKASKLWQGLSKIGRLSLVLLRGL